MAKFTTKILHSAGCSNVIELPDDVVVKDLISELIVTLSLPMVSAKDGQALEYRLDSKALGRRLKDEETVATANLPSDDTLILTVAVLAGDLHRITKKSPAESPIGLTWEKLRTVEVESLLTNETALIMTLHHHRETLAQLDDLRATTKALTSERDDLKASLREKNIATLIFILGQILTGFGINLVTSSLAGGWLVFGCGLLCTVVALCCGLLRKRKNYTDAEC